MILTSLTFFYVVSIQSINIESTTYEIGFSHLRVSYLNGSSIIFEENVGTIFEYSYSLEIKLLNSSSILTVRVLYYKVSS